MLELVDIFIQGVFSTFTILIFLIAYRADTFTIKSEKSWDILKIQYSTLYGKTDPEMKEYPNQIATLCYYVQEQITCIQWQFIYLILIADIVVGVFGVMFSMLQFKLYYLRIPFLWFLSSLVFGSVITFALCYFINNVYFGTMIKVPLRTDPLRWGYGNGLFLTMFCIGMLIASILIISLVSQYAAHEQLQLGFIVGVMISFFFRREQQQLLGRSIEISCDLLIKGNRGRIEVQEEMTYEQKLGSIIGFIQADTNLLDLLLVFSIYLVLPKLAKVNDSQTNYYLIVLLTNFFAQFIISFFISISQQEDAAVNVISNTRIQIVTASLFSVISISLLFLFDPELMGIASFGLIINILMMVFLEYMTHHSFPQVRNLGSAALNAPMLNILNASYMGDMGQCFIMVMLGLGIFISIELSGMQGLYAFLTGVLMNQMVMISIQFAGNTILGGLRIAELARIDYSMLQKINLASSNYQIYVKQTAVVGMFLITVVLMPLNDVHLFCFGLGAMATLLVRGMNLRMVVRYVVKCFQNQQYLLGAEAHQMWQIGGILLLMFASLFAIMHSFGTQGVGSFVWGFSILATVICGRSMIVGGSLKSIRIFESTKESERVIQLSHLYADAQSMALEESSSLPSLGYWGALVVLAALIER